MVLRKHTIYQNILIKERMSMMQKKTYQSKIFRKIEHILEHNITVIIISIMVFVVMIGNDIRLICLPKEADIYVDLIYLITFIVFMLEFILSCIVKENYVFSLFFWLDFVAVAALF